MAFPTSPLSSENVLRDIHDPVEQRIRVDAQVTAIVENVTVEVDLDAADDNIAIKDPVSNNILAINGDGSINANVNLSHVDDSVKLGNGTSLFTSSTVGPKLGLDVNIINQISGFATDASLASILTELQQKTEPSDVQNIRSLTSISDSISVPGVASETTLGNINSKLNTLGQKTMTGSVPVVLANDQSSIPVSLTGEPIKMSGTIDGQPNGTEFTFVNNLRQQILASHDRQAELTYADFGTKDQRITQIDYTSATFPGTTVRKQFLYTLVSGKYRRDDINWILI